MTIPVETALEQWCPNVQLIPIGNSVMTSRGQFSKSNNSIIDMCKCIGPRCGTWVSNQNVKKGHCGLIVNQAPKMITGKFLSSMQNSTLQGCGDRILLKTKTGSHTILQYPAKSHPECHYRINSDSGCGFPI